MYYFNAKSNIADIFVLTEGVSYYLNIKLYHIYYNLNVKDVLYIHYSFMFKKIK